MDKRTFRDLLILLGIIVACAIAARTLKGHETLDEYAKKNAASSSSASEASSQQPASDLAKESSSQAETSADAASSASTEPVYTPHSEDAVIYAEGFNYEPIYDEIYERIKNVSYPEGCEIKLEDLRYCRIMYVDFDGNTQNGELICSKAIADDIMEIFYELYQNDYQIESIRLIDDFDGDDNAAMEANNTSCFNYRTIGNSKKLSNHAKGLAIDINPLYNPQVKYANGKKQINPESGKEYADRSASFPYKIDSEDLAYKLFKEHGFTWGGNWNSSKDYQHFEKTKF